MSQEQSVRNLGFTWAPGWSAVQTSDCDDQQELGPGRAAAAPAVVGYWQLACLKGDESRAYLRITGNRDCGGEGVFVLTDRGREGIPRVYHAAINCQVPPPTEFYQQGEGDRGESDSGQGICDNIRVSTAANSAKGSPAIAVAPMEQAYIVWHEDTGIQMELWFRKTLNGGMDWSDEENIAVHATSPAIALDPYKPDTIYVVADGYATGSSTSDILFWASADGGAHWTTNPVIVNSSQTDTCYSPDIAMGPGGQIYVVWVRARKKLYPPGQNGDICFSKSANHGASWSTAVVIDDDGLPPTSSRHDMPKIAVDEFGKIFVVWADGRRLQYTWLDIYSTSSTDGGDSWSTNVRVNDEVTGDHIFYYPDIATPEANLLHVCWVDAREGDKNVYFSSSNDGGSTWTTDVKVNDPGDCSRWGPAIASFDLENRIYVVWNDSRANPEDFKDDIYISESIDNGNTWTPDLRLNDDPGSEDVDTYGVDIALHYDFKGVTWSDDRFDTLNIFFCSCTAEASVSDAPSDGGILRIEKCGPNPTERQYRFGIQGRESDKVRIGIYDVQGRLVRALRTDSDATSDLDIIWDGTDNQGHEVSSGSYFLIVREGEAKATKKIIVVR